MPRELQIVYEDDYLLVVDKPSLLHSTRSPTSTEPSVADLLIGRNSSFGTSSAKEDDGGLVHRLDFDTSGLLLAAKSKNTWTALRADLLEGRIKKEYSACVDGITPDKFFADNFIGPRYRRSKKVEVYPSEPRGSGRALPARTDYECVARLTGLNASLVIAHAPHARRHQVRAHAAFLGHPLTGDSLYGSSRLVQDVWPSCPDARSFLLIASRIVFTHPATKKLLDFHSSTLPPLFKSA